MNKSHELHESHGRILNSLVVAGGWLFWFTVFISLLSLEVQWAVRWRCTRRQRKGIFFYSDHSCAINNAIISWLQFMFGHARGTCCFSRHSSWRWVLCRKLRWFPRSLAHMIQARDHCSYSHEKHYTDDLASAPWKSPVTRPIIYTLAIFANRAAVAVTIPSARVIIRQVVSELSKRWAGRWSYTSPWFTHIAIWAITGAPSPYIAIASRSTDATANFPFITLLIV